MLHRLGQLNLLAVAVCQRGVEVKVAAPESAVDQYADEEHADPPHDGAFRFPLQSPLLRERVEGEGRGEDHQAQPRAVVADVVERRVAEVRDQQWDPDRTTLAAYVADQPSTCR